MDIKVGIKYLPFQEELFFGKKNPKTKVKLVHKGRRVGFTQGCTNFCTESLLDGRFKKILWGDTTLSNLEKYWTRYWYPLWKNVPDNYWNYDKQKHELRFNDECYVDFRSAERPENWEGFGYDLIILNEAGIILKNEELYYNSILPMSLDHKADMIIGGTPKGAGGLFEKLCNRGYRGDEPKYETYNFTTYDNPLIDEDEIEEYKKSVPEMVAAQEVYGKFVNDVGLVFRNVDACAAAVPDSPKDDETYYMGVDIAKTHDYFTIKIMNSSHEEVFSDRTRGKEWAISKGKIKFLSKKWNNAQVLIDATAMGGEMAYDDLVSEGVDVLPYKFTNTTKGALIRNLILGFENQDLKILNDADTISELKNFEYSITSTGLIKYGTQSGHDDTVSALALSYWLVKQGLRPTLRVIPLKQPNKQPWKSVSFDNLLKLGR